MGDHDHSPAAQNSRRLAVVVAFTSIYLVVEVVASYLTNSLALLADAGHMLTDLGGLVIALVAIRFAKRPATPERTYGFYRMEILAALVNAALLIGLSVFVLYEAYRRFSHPPEVASRGMLVVAALGFAVNVIGLMVLRAGAESSLNLRSAYYEVLADALTSIGVMIAAIIIWTTGWYYADPLISAAIGLFILPRTWKLMGEAVGILLEGAPSDVNLAAVRETIAAVEGVASVHDLHVWALTSGVNALSVHAVRAASFDADAVLAAVRRAVTSRFKIAHVTIQVESDCCAPEDTHL